jgi:hypothetical protein
MSMGKRFVITGTLDWSATYRAFILAPDTGGFWIVYLPCLCRTKRYMQQRVTVDGIRTGFNILDIDRIRLAK